MTDKYVYVTSGRSEAVNAVAHNGQRLRVYRIDRDLVDPCRTWPAEY